MPVNTLANTIKGKAPRRKQQRSKQVLTRTSKAQKSARHVASDELPSQRKRCLSPEYEKRNTHMTGQGRSIASNGSTEADSLGKEHDYLNCDTACHEHEPISLDIDAALTQAQKYISEDKHSENYDEQSESKQKRNGKRGKITDRIRKKTEMCRNIVKTGKCKFGDECSYAHEENELVTKTHSLPTNFKTKMCNQFHDPNIMYCPFGTRCQFLHAHCDLTEKIGSSFTSSYQIRLKESARLTAERIEAGYIDVWVNLIHGEGCVAPKKRLSCFMEMYNKEDYKAQLEAKATDKENLKKKSAQAVEVISESVQEDWATLAELEKTSTDEDTNLASKVDAKPWSPTRKANATSNFFSEMQSVRTASGSPEQSQFSTVCWDALHESL